MSYELSVVENKNFLPNVVIFFKDKYWGQRQPDSGLVIDADCLGVEQVAINPTKVDPFKASTTINTYTFSLVDLNYSVTQLFDGVTKFFQGEKVEIYIGRCNENMPFSAYLKLPDTEVRAVNRSKNSYQFKSTETKERLNKAAFGTKVKLQVDILSNTTIIDAETLIDPLVWTAAGFIKIENEFISYTGIDVINNRFVGCIRGEKNSIPVAHKLGETIFMVTEVIANPVDILLQCLVSKGGTGIYDVLPDGAGIDESLINVARFIEIREEFFAGHVYTLLLYGLDNILKYLETEILFPNELRIISDNSSKISLSILNRRLFDDKMGTIDDSSIKTQPNYEVDDTEIINVVNVEYDFSEGTNVYRKIVTLQDDDSINDFGKREPLELKLKGVQSEIIARNIAQRFLTRFAYPKPQISFTAQMDKSLIQLGEKAYVESAQIPNTETGELNFGDNLEVIERGINWKTGDVKFKVAFTSFTGIRECYLAPSDSILEFMTTAQIRVGSGRGSLYTVGWKMRLYSDTMRDYATADILTIKAINGDLITFDAPIATSGGIAGKLLTQGGFKLLQQDGSYILLDTYSTNTFRIMFADYDDVIKSQKLYCFINQSGLKFEDNKKPYQVTL